MNIDFSPLQYTFKTKPLVIGGKALEYYGIRKAGNDIDLIVTLEDITALAKIYPKNLKDLWGDFGVAVHNFEIWKTINCADYEYLSREAIREENYLVASLEQLIGILAPLQHISKYQNDLQLLAKKLVNDRYTQRFDIITQQNNEIVIGLTHLQYIEKTGPEKQTTIV